MEREGEWRGRESGEGERGRDRVVGRITTCAGRDSLVSLYVDSVE